MQRILKPILIYNINTLLALSVSLSLSHSLPFFPLPLSPLFCCNWKRITRKLNCAENALCFKSERNASTELFAFNSRSITRKCTWKKKAIKGFYIAFSYLFNPESSLPGVKRETTLSIILRYRHLAYRLLFFFSDTF